ncbi:MAG TPA: hypothetical protein VHF05_02835 [Candidatus Paceibacterota bacterium]|jgi:hypothetical protein|nr:hypothetical protein [Candidatus Paceibacterota bacterium]
MSEVDRPQYSEEVLQELKMLCESFGSGEEARNDPNFVLTSLLKRLNERKDSISAMTRTDLEWSITPQSLKFIRSQAAEQKSAA